MSNSKRVDLAGLIGVAFWMVLLGALFVGFVYLLSFPWTWVVKATMGLEVLLLALALMMEFSAKDVNGAGGWASFGYILGHAWLVAAMLVFRGLVLLGQWVVA
ncbi:hypothetical protein GCM10010096_35400 [Alcaligenes pakistanensis]|uniref:Uncharacterized protein n=1 Tax=Alcaligenes pakistanensis TaxID=1482717 RepID=A0A8H9M969_9BURK|nr:hypothetical protein [Alcaligenes pakistanensis]MBP6621076.1 hypothetical protein [Alcaligenes sp.]GHC59033.1 hypothetical protein GCM10010096_35400 [Alcaligenes pakistanensis]HCA17255.1 hypothetical protein [Alcaligenes faecalis]